MLKPLWTKTKKNFGEGKMLEFKANNTILFRETPLKAQNDYIF